MEYGYLRQSLDVSGDALAVTRQREALEKAGARPAEWFTDNDWSASKDKPRPDFERLLRTLGPGDLVWMVRVDRLVRRPMDLERLIELAERGGLNVRTLTGTLRLDTAEGQTHARVLVAFAAMEAKLNSERRKLANEQRAARGVPHWSRQGGRVFGYRWEEGEIVFEESEAAALRKALEDVCDGRTLAAVVRELNAAGFRTTSRNRAGELAPIDYSTLRKWLLNPRYAGWNAHRGQTFPASWPALWSDEDAFRVATLLQATDRRRSLSTRPKHLLSSIMVCYACRRGIIATNWSDGIYRCQGAHVQRRREFCDWFVETQLRARLARTAHPQTDRVDEATRRARAAELDELTARRDALVSMLAKGLLPAAKVEVEAGKLTARIEDLETLPAPTLTGSTFGRFARGAETWEQLDMPQRRALLRAEVQEIVLESFGRGPRASRENPGVSIVWIDGTRAAPLPLEAV